MAQKEDLRATPAKSFDLSTGKTGRADCAIPIRIAAKPAAIVQDQGIQLTQILLDCFHPESLRMK